MLEPTSKRRKTELESVREDIDEAAERVEQLTDDFEDRFSTLADKADKHDLGLLSSELEEAANTKLPDVLEVANEELDEVGNRIAQLKERENGLQEDREEMRQLESENKCPRCKQEVDETHIEDEIEEIETELEETRQALEEAEAKREGFRRTKGCDRLASR